MLKFIPFVFLNLLLFNTICVAQEQKLNNKKIYWANIGIGTANSEILNGISGLNFGVNYNNIIKKNNYYQIGLNTTYFDAFPTMSVFNFGLGKKYSNRFLLTALFIGPAYATGKTIQNESFHTIGITTNVQLIVKLLEDLGMGCELYSNLTLMQSTTGLRIVIHLSSK